MWRNLDVAGCVASEYKSHHCIPAGGRVLLVDGTQDADRKMQPKPGHCTKARFLSSGWHVRNIFQLTPYPGQFPGILRVQPFHAGAILSPPMFLIWIRGKS
jgi:hypothetical protein